MIIFWYNLLAHLVFFFGSLYVVNFDTFLNFQVSVKNANPRKDSSESSDFKRMLTEIYGSPMIKTRSLLSFRSRSCKELFFKFHFDLSVLQISTFVVLNKE